LEEELRELLPWLAQLLGQSEGGWRLDWLIEESSEDDKNAGCLKAGRKGSGKL
jgi:hypothetical protein